VSGSEALVADITAYAGVQALITNGDSPATYRIYPTLMPQDSTLPVVVYDLITGLRMNTIADAGGTGVEKNVFQVNAWATTLAGAEALAEQVRLALKSAGRNYVPLYKRNDYDGETRLWTVVYDFSQWYR
jgi:hypothetical protein